MAAEATAAVPRAEIEGRYFVVGCPRSGTTLLQGLIAAHPLVGGFPETFFFMHSTSNLQQQRRMPGRRPPGRLGPLRLLAAELLTRAGVTPRAPGRRSFEETVLDPEHRPDLAPLMPASRRSRRGNARAFVRILDQLTAERGRRVWVEKTPPHQGFIDLIARYVPGARFIHIAREGPAVIASLHDVALRYGDRFAGNDRFDASGFLDLDTCIDTWLTSVRHVRRYRERPGHHVVEYEELAGDPEGTLRSVCAFMGVAFDAAMLTGYADVVDSLYGDRPFLQGAKGPIESAPSKFGEVFDADQRRHVEARLTAGSAALG